MIDGQAEANPVDQFPLERGGIVRRGDDLPGVDLSRLSHVLAETIFAPAVRRAERAHEESELGVARMLPVLRLIASDEEASQAHRKLTDLRRQDRTGPSGGKRVVTSTNGGAPWSLSYDLQPGRSIFIPPYDVEPPCSTSGSPTSAHNRVNDPSGSNLVELDIPSDDNVSGARSAMGVVGLVLQASQPGTVVVRPFTKYSARWMILGDSFSAHNEGRLTAMVVDDAFQVLDQRDISLWDYTTQTDVRVEEPEGVAWPPDIELRFRATPGTPYTVLVGGVIAGNQSGDRSILTIFMGSYFSASLDVSVPWFVVELGP
jgi:hypothetical protein